jgi:hypothetical protein
MSSYMNCNTKFYSWGHHFLAYDVNNLSWSRWTTSLVWHLRSWVVSSLNPKIFNATLIACFMIYIWLRLMNFFISQQMAPCYVVFTRKKPRIYNRWHECSEQVLRFKKSRFLKYKNYDEAVRYFKASLGAATPLPSQLLLDDSCQCNPSVNGKPSCWKNVLIISLLILVFGLWMRVTMTGHYNYHT